MKANKWLNVLAAMILLGGASSSFAEVGSLKIGYVNIQEVVSKAPQAATALQKAEKEFAARQEEIKAVVNEIQTLRDRMTKERITMSDDDRRRLEEDLLRKDRDYRWKTGILDEDAKIRQNQITNEIKILVYRAIVEIAKQDQYDLVLTDGVIFKSSRVDLTDEVLEVLRKSTGKK
jgi:outer membrane protein